MQLCFGEFVLDPAARVLRRAQVEIAVEPLVFDCIELLARQPGVLVRMDELRARLWPNLHVSPSATRRVINEARRALGDTGEAQAMIRTRKGLGYVFVAAVNVAHGASSAPGYDALRAWPFVGRRAELELLQRWLGQGDSGGVCLVSGEAGAGKSSLLAQLREARGRRETWFIGQCHATPEQPAFWPCREITRQLLAQEELRAHALRLAKQAKCVSLAIPELAPFDARAPQLEAAQARFEACEAWAGLFGELARVQPLQLVFEDMHWADEGSAWMLAALARAAQREPLRVLVSYRAEHVAPAGAFAQVLARLRGRAGVLDVPLGGLSQAALLELLDALSVPGANARAAGELLQLTAGNALFVHEVVRHALATGTQLGALPASFEQIVAQRTAAVPTDTRALLELAAVLGSEFELELLHAVAGSASLPALLSELEPARRAGLVRALNDDPDRLAFSHALVADALARALPAERRQALHLAASLALARQPLAANRAALANHAFAAGGLVPRVERLRACEEAGRDAFERLEFDRAALQLGRAVSLVASDDTSAHATELTLLWAKARYAADHPDPEVGAVLLTAAERARLGEHAELFAEAAILYAVGDGTLLDNRIMFTRPDAPELVEEAWRRLVQGAPSAIEETDLAHRLATALAIYRLDGSDFSAMQHWAELALRLAPAKPSPARRSALLGLRGFSRREDAHAVLAQLSAHVQRPGLGARERIEGRGIVMFLALMHAERGSYERALREIEALAQPMVDAVRVGRFGERLSTYVAWPLVAQVTLRIVRGDLAEAAEQLALLPRELERAGVARTRRTEINLLMLWRWLAIYQGKSHALEPIVDAALRSDPDTQWLRASLELGFALERGEEARALEHYRTLRATGFEPHARGRRMPARWSTLAELGDACTQLGNGEDAALIYQRLSPHAGLVISDGTLVWWGASDRVLGALALQLGWHEAAQRHFETALDVNARLGHKPEWVRTELAFAALCDACGRSDEAEQRRARARASAEAFGMALPTFGNRPG